MNWDQIEGKWEQVKGAFKTEWAKLTDDDWDAKQGRKDRIIGKIKERYGDAKEVVEQKIDAFIDRM